MKRIIFSVFFLTTLVLAQTDKNSSVNLIFNNEAIDLPIVSVSLVKSNGLLLNFKAERNDSEVQQEVTFQVGLKELSSDNAEVLEGSQIYISNRNTKAGTGNELSIKFNNVSDKKEGNDEKANYSFYKKGEKVSWEINSISMRIGITSIKYKNGRLFIEGSCNGKFTSTLAPKDQNAEIRNCNFQIII